MRLPDLGHTAEPALRRSTSFFRCSTRSSLTGPLLTASSRTAFQFRAMSGFFCPVAAEPLLLSWLDSPSGPDKGPGDHRAPGPAISRATDRRRLWWCRAWCGRPVRELGPLAAKSGLSADMPPDRVRWQDSHSAVSEGRHAIGL